MHHPSIGTFDDYRSAVLAADYRVPFDKPASAELLEGPALLYVLRPCLKDLVGDAVRLTCSSGLAVTECVAKAARSASGLIDSAVRLVPHAHVCRAGCSASDAELG